MGRLTCLATPHLADLLIRDALIVTPDGVTPGGVLVRDGRIARLVPPEALRDGSLPPTWSVLHARGRYVLPGLVDSHVHIGGGGPGHEDWRRAGRAAAAGGVTTVIDMPDTVPPPLDPPGVAARAELVRGESLVDFRFHLGVRPDRVDLLADVVPAAAVSVTAFPAAGGPDATRDAEVFAASARAGLRLLLHVEDDPAVRCGAPPSSRTDVRDRRHGDADAVGRIVELVRRHGTAVHVVHVATAGEAGLLAAAAGQGLPVTFEVTPHHLSFTEADAGRLGPRARPCRAVRSERDRERLWDAVWRGEAATIGGGDAPDVPGERRAPADAPHGPPGVRELLPAVYAGMRARRPAAGPGELLRLIARLCADNPARLFGLAGRKGRIAPGMDADLVVFDTEERWTSGSAEAYGRCGPTARDGRTVGGRPVLTLRRGQVIWDAGMEAFGPPDGVFPPAERPADLAVRRPGGHPPFSRSPSRISPYISPGLPDLQRERS
ncbi:dihydroorotase [Microbispora corallina]|uniref:Dihydroorotase n=1 Tax=Microbispora corallina TaxID=83302 RepID=A0ABQ4G1X0_9ACTN|nr:dihydroorotase family protein [Microbispora corallina]GIH41035.1 dihydroorotase [Microbispora corallina]